MNAALASKKHGKAAKQGTRLEVKSPIIKQGNQGFNKTPARWKSSPTPGRRS